jgi:phosphoribosylglycinamide formyltransferase 1
MKKIVILISGRGSNMQALLAANLPCSIAAVISNRADAQGLHIAQAQGIATTVVEHKAFANRELFDAALAQTIDAFQPDFIILAGFMRILSAGFVQRFYGKLINIHPSLLPAYAGMHTHQRALDDGVKIHGCTVHFVSADLDLGPIIIQAAIPVLQSDCALTLSRRLLVEEHRVYAQAIRWLCSEQVRLNPHGKVDYRFTKQIGHALFSPGLE